VQLGDDLDEFSHLVTTVYPKSFLYFKDYIFTMFRYRIRMFFEADELLTLQHNLGAMQMDIRLQYEEAFGPVTPWASDSSLKQSTLAAWVDLPYILTQTFYDGHMLTEVHLGSHDFYMLADGLVRNALLNYGIAESRDNPFSPSAEEFRSRRTPRHSS